MFFTIIIGLLAFAAGVLITWLVARNRHAAQDKLHAAQDATQAERLRANEAAAAKADAELQSARDTELQLREQLAKAAADLAAAKEAHARLTQEFRALSADALSKNSDEFLKLARASFDKLHQQSADELGKRAQAIDALVKPIRESLQKVDTTIGEIEKTRATAYGALSEQIKSLTGSQNQLQAEAAKLSTALRSTTTAGTWGELQLRRVIEMAGMSSYCDFAEQTSVTDGERTLRPDVVVQLPGSQHIVIDAKTPLDAYREAASASDDKVRAAKLAEHAAKVRGHVDSLGAKDYWEQFQPSPEFVVLFLPGDQFLAGALQADATLIDRAMAKRVLLATPATLIALLKASAYGWRQESISQNAEEIAALGRQLYDRISTFTDHLARVGAGLGAATKHYNAAVGSLEGSLLPGARKFVELKVHGTKQLASPEVVDTAPREISRRD